MKWKRVEGRSGIWCGGVYRKVEERGGLWHVEQREVVEFDVEESGGEWREEVEYGVE